MPATDTVPSTPVHAADPPTSDWTAIAGICGLWADSAAYCWRDDGEPPLAVAMHAARSERFVALGANLFHACALAASGTLYCWGSNNFGQLGDGTTTSRDTAVAVRSELPFVSLAVGINHTCALTAAGAAYCWGMGDKGQLGIGAVPERCFGAHPCSTLPRAVAGSHAFVALSAGGYDRSGTYADGLAHTCAVSREGAAYCWGWNAYGQLGDGSRVDAAVPVPVSGDVRFGAFITTGAAHTCGLTAYGQAFCWGLATLGQLGTELPSSEANLCVSGDIASECSLSPVAAETALRFRGIRAGHGYTCALSLEDAAYCWGSNVSGGLGTGEIPHASPWGTAVPTPVTGGLRFVRLSTLPTSTSCGLTPSGDAYCWGAGRAAPVRMPVPSAGR